MDDLKVEGAALKKMVKLAKKQALSFGFCPGKQNDHVFMIHRRKNPEMLGKLARQEGGSPKVAFGTFQVKGRTLEMTCGRTVPQMAKTLKKYLKSQKITANVVILGEDGEMLESDIEDLAPDSDMDDDAAPDTQDELDASGGSDDPQPEAEAEDTTQAPPDAAALVARLKALQPAITAAEGAVAAKLQKVMAGAVAQIKAARLEQAETTVTALEAAVAKLGTSAAPKPDAGSEAEAQPQPDFQALAQRAKAIQGALADVSSPARDKLMTALTSAAQQIKERNHDSAEAMLGKIEAALAKVSAATRGPAQDAPYAQARQDWITARTSLRADIEALKTAIETATAGQPGLEEVAGRTDMLFDYIKDINGDLELTLQKLADTSDPAQRDALIAEANRIVRSYRDTLDSAFFMAVDDNGFVKTDIRASTLSSLQQVSAALAA